MSAPAARVAGAAGIANALQFPQRRLQTRFKQLAGALQEPQRSGPLNRRLDQRCLSTLEGLQVALAGPQAGITEQPEKRTLEQWGIQSRLKHSRRARYAQLAADAYTPIQKPQGLLASWLLLSVRGHL